VGKEYVPDTSNVFAFANAPLKVTAHNATASASLSFDFMKVTPLFNEPPQPPQAWRLQNSPVN